MDVVLKPEWLVDGTGSASQRGQAVVIRNGIIAEIVPAESAGTDPQLASVDVPGVSLLPGLINNHVHLNLPGSVEEPFLPWLASHSDSALALHGVRVLREMLEAGITTVRDCGSRGTTVLDLRDAQRSGWIAGSRVLACGAPLTITGGHGRPFGGECDGIDGVRRMVRQQISNGADFIKVLGSGGGTPGSLPGHPSFLPSELEAIVEVSHSLGRAVTVHCSTASAMANAVEAGADGIEHGTFGAPDRLYQYEPVVAEQIARAGLTVTTTLQVYRDMAELPGENAHTELWKQRSVTARESMSRLRGLGVRLLAGSDAGWRATAFTTYWRELEELVTCGLSPVEAIHASTGAVADALGMADRFGTIRAGLAADLLLVDGDAAADIRCLRDVRAVLQGGELVSGNLASAARHAS